MKTRNLNQLKILLESGLSEGVYPGAVLLVAHQGERIFFEAAGHALVMPHAVPMKKETIFDLASLTKPLGTTLAVMKLVEEEQVRLDEPLDNILGKVVPPDKQAITPRLLLSHASGLPDWEPFFSRLEGVEPGIRKQTVREWILKTGLTCIPGREARYSDPGFMLLEWVIEECSGMTLNRFLQERFYGPLGLRHTFFYDRDTRAPFGDEEFAATEACPWRKIVLQGKVHDENAYAMGGYSGHAGLFGTTRDVYKLAGFLVAAYLGKGKNLLAPKTVRTFFTRQGSPKNTTWALGWDTPSRENSSAGKYFSQESVGHLGFTGVSLWIDLKKRVVVIFLTNRVHPTRENEKIRPFRPRLHDRVMEVLGLTD
jgi:CubicO group peptidase (beta-lactamase class C family)